MPRSRVAAAVHLIASCLVLGVGVGLVLSARLGSDGYSSLINGIARSSGLPYVAVNPAVGLSAVLLARAKGVRPGPGTITHPVVVGVTVNAVLNSVSAPSSLVVRIAMLLTGAVVLAVGVAGYLDADLGAGPFEAATLALQPIPFRLAYILLQAVTALIGWSLGADIGPGTLFIVFGTGPIIHALRNHMQRHRQPDPRRRNVT